MLILSSMTLLCNLSNFKNKQRIRMKGI